MHEHAVPLTNADEEDAFTQWRRYLYWKAGERRKIKQRYRRRCRRVAKLTIKAEELYG